MIRARNELYSISAYNPPLKERGGKIRLDFNENTNGPSPKVIRAIQEMNGESVSMYPDPAPLKEKLAFFLNLKKEQVLLANGSDEAILLTLYSFLERGDRIIIPDPTFSIYELYAASIGADIKKVEYNADFTFPTKKIISEIIPKTRMIILVSPNNPTGTVIARRDIEEIIKKAKEVGCLVVLDEAYWQYYGKTNYDFITKYDNVVVFQTFSKAYGLAGVRVGYAVAQESIISVLEKLRPPYTMNITAITAATVALDDQEYVDSYVKEVSEAKKIIEKFARENSLMMYPTGSNFCIMKVGDKNKEIIASLKEKGILLRELKDSELLRGCMRVGIGNRQEMQTVINALKDILVKEKT